MHFDGARFRTSTGVGIIFTSPRGDTTSFSYILEFETTNNVVEYEVIFLGLELARDMGIQVSKIMRDFDLVAMQVKDEFAVKGPKMID
jgi:ribonuclease HI